jgi:hypothetical protein
MRTRSDAIPDVGRFQVWQGDLLWLSGLVKREDAERLAEQANQAAKAVGKRARYVVREQVVEEQTA